MAASIFWMPAWSTLKHTLIEAMRRSMVNGRWVATKAVSVKNASHASEDPSAYGATATAFDSSKKCEPVNKRMIVATCHFDRREKSAEC
jgi:hypothetical protein